MGPNMYTLQCKAQRPAKALIRLERIRFIHAVWQSFSRVQRFLARRAILRKIKDRPFTKLAAFIRIITGSDNTDTGVISGQIVFAYLGLTSSLEDNCILELRSKTLIKTKKGVMQFG